jgi:bacteriocin biosynthesis cyclodehydratase domain-containing protein
MIQKPRLKSFLTVYPLSSDTWALRGGAEELWRIKLNEGGARTLGLLLSYLDGSHEREAILDGLESDGGNRDIAARLLDHLDAGSFLEEADSDALTPEQADRYRDQIMFFSRFSKEGGVQAQATLASARVGVVGDGRLARRLVRGLERSGIGEVIVLATDGKGARYDGGGARSNGDGARSAGGVVSYRALDRMSIWPEDAEDEPPAWWVLAQEAHDPHLPAAFDKFSQLHNVPWLLVRLLDAHEGWVGPLFVPGETASFASLEGRLRGNLTFYEEYEALDKFLRENAAAARPVGGLHASYDVLAAIAVSEIVKLVTGAMVPHLAGRFITLSFLTWETQVHDVLRIPHLEPRSQQRPVLYAWKEPPYGDAKTRRG